MTKHWPLILTGCFALIWCVHRAQAQSITFDEANTFFAFVVGDGPWSPNSNNHVLNSILIRLFVKLFGVSQLSVRAPALLGGALYIFAAYRICTLLACELALTWPLFVCFVYNPFVMDYLVAARGYGLAIGFLSLSLYLIARMLFAWDGASERKILKTAVAASVAGALSFCANFSFAYVNGALIAVLFVWAGQDGEKGAPRMGRSRPGLCVARNSGRTGVDRTDACQVPQIRVVLGSSFIERNVELHLPRLLSGAG